ncbi:MAG: tetratricopeptide repeat protein [Campylobacteraceae bacterium]
MKKAILALVGSIILFIVVIFISIHIETSKYELAVKHYKAKEFDKAMSYFKKECEFADFNACGFVGVMYLKGEGVEVDFSTAVTYFEKGCKGTNFYTCSILGMMYENGHGVKKDSQKAIQFHTKACEKNIMESCEYVKKIEENQNNKTSRTK